MSKLLLLIIAAHMALFPFSCAYAARILSDAELDCVSAQGFDFDDIDINAVLNLQRGAGIIQNNIAAVSGKSQTATQLYNDNIALAEGLQGNASVKQENIAAVVASGGDIVNAQINNENYAVASASGSAAVRQKNTALLIALNGDIVNSAINNVNHAVAGAVQTTSVVQQNIAIVIASGIIDAAISNVNSAVTAGNAVVNSVSGSTYLFTYKNFSGIINTDIQHQ